eukprot:TRINITY_DN30216_c0_g1_i1.p1 TRINITY_DN30216_c0_g1~~TRINITY_DN30216_c0_g1_i1.p1  ORF type:complete len:370 (-),score=69.41 TRINITY_DN30216_c0_g1_i1:76-1185(-)
MAVRKVSLGAPITGGVKLVVFDFDQTLSCIHVFKTLAGWSEGDGPVQVPRPAACTERGQVRRIQELDQSGQFKDGFAVAAFGGPARVQQVRNTLICLKEQGAELVICTKGLIGTVRQCLLDLDMLSFFSEVYGNFGGDTYGQTAYDKQVAKLAPTEQEVQLLGTPQQASWGTKPELIARLMRERRLRREQAVIVEDDPEEIRRATPVCRTVWVKEAQGMTLKELEALQRMTVPEAGSSRGRGGDVDVKDPRSGYVDYVAGAPDRRNSSGDRGGHLNWSGGSNGKREVRGAGNRRERKPPVMPSPAGEGLAMGGLDFCSGSSAPRLGMRSRACSQPPGGAQLPLPTLQGGGGQLPPLRRPPRLDDGRRPF